MVLRYDRLREAKLHVLLGCLIVLDVVAGRHFRNLSTILVLESVC